MYILSRKGKFMRFPLVQSLLLQVLFIGVIANAQVPPWSDPKIEITAVKSVIKSSPEALKGVEYYANGDIRNADLFLEKARSTQDNWAVFFLSGRVKQALGQFKESDKFFKKAVALEPNLASKLGLKPITGTNKDTFFVRCPLDASLFPEQLGECRVCGSKFEVAR